MEQSTSCYNPRSVLNTTVGTLRKKALKESNTFSPTDDSIMQQREPQSRVIAVCKWKLNTHGINIPQMNHSREEHRRAQSRVQVKKSQTAPQGSTVTHHIWNTRSKRYNYGALMWSIHNHRKNQKEGNIYQHDCPLSHSLLRSIVGCEGSFSKTRSWLQTVLLHSGCRWWW